MTLKHLPHRHLNNEKGMAMIESLPMLIIFLVFVGYGMGLFGVIHTGILHSIAARGYAFETIRNRNNLKIFRENNDRPETCEAMGMRFHGIQAEPGQQDVLTATSRPIVMGLPVPAGTNNQADHNQRIFSLDPRNRSVQISPAWVMVGYGICLNARCGEN